MNLDLLVLVPARGGSKRLPGKNLAMLGGRTLLAHTAEAIEAAGLGATVVLSTDDDMIAAEGERLGWQVPFRRPETLAGDEAPTIAAVTHALDWFRGLAGRDASNTMVLQPTSPLRGEACLRHAVQLLEDCPDVDSVIAMTESNIPAAHTYAAEPDGCAAPVADDTRTPVYRPNGGLYLSRTDVIRREGTLFAGRIAPLVMHPLRAIDIDTADDLKLAKAVFEANILQGAGCRTLHNEQPVLIA